MDPLTLAGALPVEQCEHNSVGQQQPCRGVVDGDADAHRALPGVPGNGHQPAHALGDLVDAGPAGVRSVLAKPGDAAIDDARIDIAHRLVVDVTPGLYVRFSSLDYYGGPP